MPHCCPFFSLTELLGAMVEHIAATLSELCLAHVSDGSAPLRREQEGAVGRFAAL